MATANELFAANGEDYIVIDSDLRTMTFPTSVNNIGVENDKDVHKLNFKMPRYYSGYDLSEFIIHINYVNANGDADMYYVLNPTIEENEIKFSWLVGRHACLYRGSVTFIVCLKLTDGEGDVAQEFNTTLASLQVLPGLETEPTILETEHDIIEQLLLSINDTNAKIKAVLDTGLTPEQIAEFYNKSKNYDTKITANANAITDLNSGLTKYRIIYNATYSVSGNVYNSPSISQAIDAIAAKGARRYYVECIASNSYSDTYSAFTLSNTTLIVDVISANYINMFALTVGNQYGITLYRTKTTSWGNWVKHPIQDDIDALNSRTALAWHAARGNQVKTDIQAYLEGLAASDLNGFHVFWNTLADSDTVGAPITSSCYYIAHILNSEAIRIVCYVMGKAKSEIYTKQKYANSWGEWIELPTRGEVDALNSSLTTAAGAPTAPSGCTLVDGGYWVFGKWVFLDVIVTVDEAKTTYDSILGGLPRLYTPGTSAPISACVSNVPRVAMVSNSNVYVGGSIASISAGATVRITGCYCKRN